MSQISFSDAEYAGKRKRRDRSHAARAACAALHLVHDQQRAAAVAGGTQPLQELGGGRHVAASP